MINAKDPENIFINDEMLVCNQCEFDQFYSSKYNPGKDGVNFQGFDWTGTSIDVFVCGRCGFFHWFASMPPMEKPVDTLPIETTDETLIPERDPDTLSEPSECLSCGKVIPQGRDHCPACGWTYKEPMKEK